MLKDYDISVLYHLGKANIVADTRSRLSICRVSQVEDDKNKLVTEVHQLALLGVHLIDSTEGSVFVQNSLKSSLVVEVKEKQDRDPT